MEEVIQHPRMRDSIHERFIEFSREHPEVYRELEVLATVWLRRHDRLGIGMLWERLRWEYGVGDHSGKDFKLNNDYRSHFARLLIRNHPEWTHRIQIRQLRTP